MQPRKRIRVLVTAATAAALLAGAAAPALAAVAHSVPMPGHSEIDPVVRLSAQRILVSDQVAAAKWYSGRPIDDPVRERQVLDSAAAEARRLHTDPGEVVRVFRDQIEASKAVQRGLLREWTADPSRAPATRPDLGRVRVVLNELGDRLVHALAETAAARRHRTCPVDTALEYVRVSGELGLDGLHEAALARALPSVCE